MLNLNLDKNNIETGKYLPEEMRYYINSVQYVHKYGVFAQALQASKIILST